MKGYKIEQNGAEYIGNNVDGFMKISDTLKQNKTYFVLDASGSMGWNNGINVLLSWIKKDIDNKHAYILFGSDAKVYTAREAIDQLNDTMLGCTNPENGFMKLIEIAKEDEVDVIFLTDGKFSSNFNIDWSFLVDSFKKINLTYVGYKNDKMDNTTNMRKYLEFTYTFVKNANTAIEYYDTLMSYIKMNPDYIVKYEKEMVEYKMNLNEHFGLLCTKIVNTINDPIKVGLEIQKLQKMYNDNKQKFKNKSQIREYIKNIVEYRKDIIMKLSQDKDKGLLEIKSKLGRNNIYKLKINQRKLKNKDKSVNFEVLNLMDIETKSEELNNMYSCVYSLNSWSDMIEENDFFTILFQYTSEIAVFDMCPETIRIDSIDLTGFISGETFIDMYVMNGCSVNNMFNDNNKNKIKNMHSNFNGCIPIITNNKWGNRLDSIINILSLITTCEEGVFSYRHIKLYCSVLNKLLSIKITERSSLLINLTVNTFKLLFTRFNYMMKESKVYTYEMFIEDLSNKNFERKPNVADYMLLLSMNAKEEDWNNVLNANKNYILKRTDIKKYYKYRTNPNKKLTEIINDYDIIKLYTQYRNLSNVLDLDNFTKTFKSEKLEIKEEEYNVKVEIEKVKDRHPYYLNDENDKLMDFSRANLPIIISDKKINELQKLLLNNKNTFEEFDNLLSHILEDDYYLVKSFDESRIKYIYNMITFNIAHKFNGLIYSYILFPGNHFFMPLEEYYDYLNKTYGCEFINSPTWLSRLHYFRRNEYKTPEDYSNAVFPKIEGNVKKYSEKYLRLYLNLAHTKS